MRCAGTSIATSLTAFIRVPLAWYRSTTFAFLPDESTALIHRASRHPTEQHTKRHFCGFFGTPLSYWSEEPRSETEYIHLTLGRLWSKYLDDFEDLGLIPDPEEANTGTAGRQDENQAAAAPVPAPAPAPALAPKEVPAVREGVSTPWFDSMMAGSQLGRLRTSSQSHDGRTRMEWEVVEWTSDDTDAPSPAKRARQDNDEEHAGHVFIEYVHH